MQNLDFLSRSVEAARLASAEEQMAPAEPRNYISCKPLSRFFMFEVSGPHFVPEFTEGGPRERWVKCNYIKSIEQKAKGVYLVCASPTASRAIVELEFESHVLPF